MIKIWCALSGDQLRLGSGRRERSYRERGRDGQLSTHTRRGAVGFRKILVQPVECRRIQRGRARPERLVIKIVYNNNKRFRGDNEYYLSRVFCNVLQL